MCALSTQRRENNALQSEWFGAPPRVVLDLVITYPHYFLLPTNLSTGKLISMIQYTPVSLPLTSDVYENWRVGDPVR